MMRWIPFFLLFAISDASGQHSDRPALVIGLVVDQMRWDYLFKFGDRYTEDGFRRLLREGFECRNTRIPYMPTVTGAGHACIYTGSVPALNGIAGNYWYDRQEQRVVYCTEDPESGSVGSFSSAGKRSPRRMWSSTISDEMRLFSGFRSRSISIAMKDRAAILSGGHTANASYWFDPATGGWISSTFYMHQLPGWVKSFNGRKLPDDYLRRDWHLLFPADSYISPYEDDKNYEGALPGGGNRFPHKTSGLRGPQAYEAFGATPWGNSYTLEFAKEAISGEQLGRGGYTDFLSVSLSSSDIIGHIFGPASRELEDCYLRLDRDIASFLRFLDSSLGAGRYLLFLTADHGVADNPFYLSDHRVPSGIASLQSLLPALNDSIRKIFSVERAILHLINHQLYLDHEKIAASGAGMDRIKHYLAAYMTRLPGISHVVDMEKVQAATIPENIRQMLNNSYNARHSGDLYIIFKPQWLESGGSGTTHGSWNPYDARVPLLWYGWQIHHGRTTAEISLADIAPTLAALLGIPEPNASVGKVIAGIMH